MLLLSSHSGTGIAGTIHRKCVVDFYLISQSRVFINVLWMQKLPVTGTGLQVMKLPPVFTGPVIAVQSSEAGPLPTKVALLHAAL